MASAVCRSKSLSNLFVERVTALDITELIEPENNRNNQWVYVISVTWSDMRETKIFRDYKELSDLYAIAHKLRSTDKTVKLRCCPDLPKVPVRGFFDWSLIKLMIRNQAKVDHFLNILITLPMQISRHKLIIDFFETKESDNRHNAVRSSNPKKSSNEGTNFPESAGSGAEREDRMSVSENNSFAEEEEENTNRTRAPPNYLPVTSCFEPDDFVPSEGDGYQTLLEDITSFDLYEDYELLYNYYPSKKINNKMRNNFHNDSRSTRRTAFYEQEWWLKECEEILSPYSPNKAYFRLVQDFEIL